MQLILMENRRDTQKTYPLFLLQRIRSVFRGWLKHMRNQLSQGLILDLRRYARCKTPHIIQVVAGQNMFHTVQIRNIGHRLVFGSTHFFVGL